MRTIVYQSCVMFTLNTSIQIIIFPDDSLLLYSRQVDFYVADDLDTFLAFSG